MGLKKVIEGRERWDLWGGACCNVLFLCKRAKDFARFFFSFDVQPLQCMPLGSPLSCPLSGPLLHEGFHKQQNLTHSSGGRGEEKRAGCSRGGGDNRDFGRVFFMGARKEWGECTFSERATTASSNVPWTRAPRRTARRPRGRSAFLEAGSDEREVGDREGERVLFPFFLLSRV